MYQEELSENGKKILEQINPNFRDNPCLIARIRSLCKSEIDSSERKYAFEEPQYSVTEDGTKINYSRKRTDGTTYITDEIKVTENDVLEIKCVGNYDEEEKVAAVLCTAMKWDKDFKLIGYVDTDERFPSKEMIDPESLLATHRPDGLEYLQCHESGNIVPIQYVRTLNYSKYDDPDHNYLLDGPGIHEVLEGQTNGKGVHSSAAEISKHVLYDGFDEIATFDSGKGFVFDPELGVSSLEEYAGLKEANKAPTK